MCIRDSRITAANSLAPGGYGILEPKDARPYSGAIDLVFVPGLVFNAQGYRIGYGKGYYDKFFFTMHKPCVKVGLAYSCQLCKDKFGEKHDVRMDWVVTQQGGICCER